METVDVLTRGQRSRGEGGFTLVEMLATIVIMGIIVVPLTSALMQALNTVPTSGARTQQSTDADRLEARLMQDLTTSNWTQIAVQPAGTSYNNAAAYLPGGTTMSGSPAFITADMSQAMPCPTTAKEPGILQTTVYDDVSDNYIWTGTTPNWKVGGQHWIQYQYRVKFTPLTGGMDSVQVFRANTNISWNPTFSATGSVDEPVPYLTGYCKQTTDSAVVTTTAAAPSATNQSETYTLKFSVRPTASANPTVFTVSATQRVHSQPPS